jgi:hypothetical protein
VTYQGAPLVKGNRLTGFTNGEEEEMYLTHVVIFLVEDELLRLGAPFEKLADWQPLSIHSELRSIVDRAICTATIEGGRMSTRKLEALRSGDPPPRRGIKALMARGFHKPGDVENRLGYYLG